MDRVTSNQSARPAWAEGQHRFLHRGRNLASVLTWTTPRLPWPRSPPHRLATKRWDEEGVVLLEVRPSNLVRGMRDEADLESPGPVHLFPEAAAQRILEGDYARQEEVPRSHALSSSSTLSARLCARPLVIDHLAPCRWARPPRLSYPALACGEGGSRPRSCAHHQSSKGSRKPMGSTAGLHTLQAGERTRRSQEGRANCAGAAIDPWGQARH
jgi:hypothetical protein